MSTGFDEIVATVNQQAREYAYEARALIRAAYPAVVEVATPKHRLISYGVGPQKTERFCYIAVDNGYIDIGFPYGVELPDPDHLLTGNGKCLRHVKIFSLGDLANPALRKLIVAATTHHMPRKPAA